jgi:exosortase/archaeosortase family protein
VGVSDRHVMLAFAGCATLATLWHRIVLEGVASGQVLSVPFSAVEVLAFFALFVVISRMKNDTLFTRVELLIIAALGVAFVLPSQRVACVAMTAAALMFVTPCSAFHSISVAVIIWLGLIKVERLHFVRSDWWALAAMIGVTILLNTIRITLMAQSLTMLQYWHDGMGVTIVTVVMLVSLLAISLLSRAGSAPKLA